MKNKNKNNIITFIGDTNTFLFKNKKKKLLNIYEKIFYGNNTNLKKKKEAIIDYKNKSVTYLNRYINLKEKKNNSMNILFFFSNLFFFYKKFKFKGKGFKIKKTKTKKFKFFFGYSHFIFFFNFTCISKKINKYKHIFFLNNLKKLKRVVNYWTKIKKVSWYTKRGLRLSKQYIQKRAGKKSTY